MMVLVLLLLEWVVCDFELFVRFCGMCVVIDLLVVVVDIVGDDCVVEWLIGWLLLVLVLVGG